MPTITLTKKELKNIIKESVKETLDAEVMKLRALALPQIAAKEQKEIEKLYGKPKRKKASSYLLKI